MEHIESYIRMGLSRRMVHRGLLLATMGPAMRTVWGEASASIARGALLQAVRQRPRLAVLRQRGQASAWSMRLYRRGMTAGVALLGERF